MTLLNRVFLGISIVLLLSFAMVSYFVATVDANHYKKDIVQFVKENTGRDLHLTGDIKLSVYPNIAFTFGEMALSNGAGFGAVAFARVNAARAKIRLKPLLQRQLKIDSIQLDGLQLNLHKKADGDTNWRFLFNIARKTTHKKESELPDPYRSVLTVLDALLLTDLKLNQMTLHWRDDKQQQRIQANNIDLTSTYRPNDKRLNLKIEGQLVKKQQQQTLQFQLATDVLLPIKRSLFPLELKPFKLKASMQGFPVLAFDLSSDLEVFNRMLLFLPLKLSLENNPIHFQNAEIKANLKGGLKAHLNPAIFYFREIDLETQINHFPHPESKTTLHLLTDASVSLASQRMILEKMQLSTESQAVVNKNSQVRSFIQSKGKSDLDIKQQTLLIDQMKLSADTQHIIAPFSQTKTQLTSHLKLDLKKSQLALKALQLTTQALHLVDKKGQATVRLSGDVLANIKEKDIDISNMALAVNAKALPQIDALQANVVGNLKASINPLSLRLKKATITGELTSPRLSGGHLSATLKSRYMLINPEKEQLKLHNMKLQARLQGGLIKQGELLHRSRGHLDIDLKAKKGKARLNRILFQIGDAKLTGRSQLTRLSPQLTFSGLFKTNRFEIKPLLNTFGLSAPPLTKDKTLNKAQASFRLTATPHHVAIKSLKLKVDRSTLTGNLSLDYTQHNQWQAKLKIDRLPLDDYLPLTNYTPAKPLALTNEPLPQQLKTLNLNASLDIERLDFKHTKFNQVQLNIDANRGLIQLDPIAFQAFKGRYSGAISLNTQGSLPTLTMEHRLEQLRIEQLIKSLSLNPSLSGNLSLSTILSTRGNTLSEIKQNLNGKMTVLLEKGTLESDHLIKKLAVALNKFEPKKAPTDAESESSKPLSFTQLKGDWTINKGVFSSDNLALLATRFLITGKGNINSINQQLDFRLRIKSPQRNSRLFAPLRLYGSIDQPQSEIELNQLINALVNEHLYKKKEALSEGIINKKGNVIQQFEARQQNELQRLKEKTEHVRTQLKATQDRLKERLQQQQDKIKQQQEKLNHMLNDRIKTLTGENP